MWPVRWLASAATKWTMTLRRCCILLLFLLDCLLVALNCTRVDRNLPLEIAFVCVFVCLFVCFFVCSCSTVFLCSFDCLLVVLNCTKEDTGQ